MEYDNDRIVKGTYKAEVIGWGVFLLIYPLVKQSGSFSAPENCLAGPGGGKSSVAAFVYALRKNRGCKISFQKKILAFWTADWNIFYWDPLASVSFFQDNTHLYTPSG